MNTEKYEPIDWPSWWRGKGEHFLEGAPLIGTHRKIIEHVRKFLRTRTYNQFMNIWMETEIPAKRCELIAKGTFHCVKPYVSWPNWYFFPEDKTALLLGQIPGVWFDPEDVVKDVSDRFSLTRESNPAAPFLERAVEACIGTQWNNPAYCDNIENGTFGQLVRLIEKEGVV